MGRPPTNGTPAFRFTSAEVEEMETILQDHSNKMPAREVLVSISDKFSNSPERQGKSLVQTKQIWNWFQNKRHAIRATSSKTPTKLIVSSMQSASTVAPPASLVSTMPAMQATPAVPVAPSVPTITVVSKQDNLSTSGLPQSAAASHGKLSSDNIPMEFEARSARDGAWYDVSAFLSLKNLEAGEPEVLVRFNGFGAEEDEWINVRKNVRHRSLPCETSECVAVLPGDLILCFQEGKEQALYFDAHVLDAQRRRHDVRGCRCRFLVRYEHDQSEEIVQLRKICRRPETEYRLQQLHAMNESSAEQGKSASATQHKTVSSVDQIKPDVDLSFTKTGSSNSVVPSVQNPYAPNLNVNSSVSEELKGAFDYSTDKTAEDMNDALSSTQHSHPVLIGLEPRDEAERNMLEAKATTDYMTVEETLDKPCVVLETTNAMLIYADDTAKTCNTVEQIVGDPRTEHSATEVVTNEAALAAGTDPIAEDGQQDDSEQMVVETNSTTGERRTDIDISKIDPGRSTDPHMPAEAKITKTNLPDEAGINIADGSGPEMVSSVSTGVTLESNGDVTEPSAVIDAGKADFDMGNVTLPSAGEDADHPCDDSGTNK